MSSYHLDSDVLIYATSVAGPERTRLITLADGSATLHMSAVAWYEYSRGSRLPEQLALARHFLEEDDGVVSFTDELASRAAEVFRQLGSPRRRANDIAIGVTAAACDAILLTRNARDFMGVPDLQVEALAPST